MLESLGIWPAVVAIGTFVLGLLGVGLYRKGGRDRETSLRADAQARDISNRDTRNEVDRAVARDPDPVDGLRRGRWFRD